MEITLGYLNDKAIRNGYSGWPEYYKYLVRCKREKLEKEIVEKIKEGNVKRKEERKLKKKVIQDNILKLGIKKNQLKLRLVDLINSE